MWNPAIWYDSRLSGLKWADFRDYLGKRARLLNHFSKAPMR